MTKADRIPVRTCVGCRRRAPQSEFVRITRSADGRTGVDAAARAPGRGAYVCSNVRCFDRAVSRGGLSRALRGGVSAADIERMQRRFVE